jgi:hypothetical protein
VSKLEMLTPQNSAIALIDYQPAMYQAVQSHDRLVTFNNVQVIATCGVHGHDHARAWSGRLPVSDLKSFWGALGCACWAV